MGIQGLPSLINKLAGGYAVKSYNFSRFARMTVAIDTSLIVHQTVIALRSGGKDLKNKQGQLTSHLNGLFYKVLIFLQNEIVPIFVFDGKAPDIKNKTIEKRRERKMLAEKNLKTLSDSEGEEYIKNFKQSFKPTKQDYKECQILLDLMGIPYIQAPNEADVVCSWLAARYDPNSKKRYVKGVCSDDSDMLALGAPYLFKDMLKFMSKNKQVKVISLNRALTKMNMTNDQFINLCVLMGCDYCDRIRGIGPKKIYKLISDYGTLEKVMPVIKKSKPNIIIDESTMKCMIEARDYFKNALKELDDSDQFVITDDNLKLRQIQKLELMDFMCVKHNFDVNKIKIGVDRLESYYKKMNIIKPNLKNVYQIIQPNPEVYMSQAFDSDDIEFRSSDDETDSKELSPKYHTQKIIQNK